MIKLLSAIFCVFLLFMMPHRAYAQEFQAAVIAGLNMAQVDGDEVYGYHKPGVNTGLSAIVPLGRNFNFCLETLFSQKGAYQGDQYYSTDADGNVYTGAYNIRLNYLEVPFLVLFNDKEIIMAGGGFSYGRLVGIKEYEHGQKTATTLTSGTYTRDDFEVIADVRFRVYKKFKINIRYAYSMVPIRSREFVDFLGNSWERKQYNNVLSLRVIYTFNEKPPLAKQK